jgi:hypothetical protein
MSEYNLFNLTPSKPLPRVNIGTYFSLLFYHSGLTCSPLRILVYGLNEQILALSPTTIQDTGKSLMPCSGFQGDRRKCKTLIDCNFDQNHALQGGAVFTCCARGYA